MLHFPPRRCEAAIDLNTFIPFAQQFTSTETPCSLTVPPYIWWNTSSDWLSLKRKPIHSLGMNHRYIERVPATIMDGNTFCLYHWQRRKIKNTHGENGYNCPFHICLWRKQGVISYTESENTNEAWLIQLVISKWDGNNMALLSSDSPHSSSSAVKTVFMPTPLCMQAVTGNERGLMARLLLRVSELMPKRDTPLP